MMFYIVINLELIIFCLKAWSVYNFPLLLPLREKRSFSMVLVEGIPESYGMPLCHYAIMFKKVTLT